MQMLFFATLCWLVPDKESNGESSARLIIERDARMYLRKGQVVLFLPLPIVTPNVNSRCKYSPAAAALLCALC